MSRYEPVKWYSTIVDLTGYTKKDLMKLPGRLVGTGELLDPCTEKDPLVFYNTIRGSKNVQILWAKPEDFPDVVFLHGKVAVRTTVPFEPERYRRSNFEDIWFAGKKREERKQVSDYNMSKMWKR